MWIYPGLEGLVSLFHFDVRLDPFTFEQGALPGIESAGGKAQDVSVADLIGAAA